MIDIVNFDKDALDIVHRLRGRGFHAYFVGGCVRDLLLGRKPKDFDIATNAKPHEIKRVIPHCYIIGQRFRLVLARRGEKQFEIATFRREPEHIDENAMMNENIFGSPEDDAFRRDFTLNALFFDPTKKELLDYVNGAQDIREKVIRVIGDPVVRFQEDPIRMLRAIRFSARLGFKLAKDTREGILYCAETLSLSVPDRLREEILRVLREGDAKLAFHTMETTGVLRALLPEWLALKHHSLPSEHSDQATKKRNWTALFGQLFGKSEVSLYDLFYNLMSRLDASTSSSPSAFLLTVFLYPTLRLALHIQSGKWDVYSREELEELKYLREFQQSFRLSNQEMEGITSLLLLRQRLHKAPQPHEVKLRGSVLRHPGYPYAFLLKKWEAEAFRDKETLRILDLWEAAQAQLLDTGFLYASWLTPGPYEQRDTRRATRSGGGTPRAPGHTSHHTRPSHHGPASAGPPTGEAPSGGPRKRRRRRKRRRPGGGAHSPPSTPSDGKPKSSGEEST